MFCTEEFPKTLYVSDQVTLHRTNCPNLSVETPFKGYDSEAVKYLITRSFFREKVVDEKRRFD